MPTLYPFQEIALDQVRAAIREGSDRVLFQLPTGGGKTIVAAEMVRRVTDQNMGGLFVVHRDFLVQQAVETITDFGVRCGVIQSGQPMDLSAPMQVAMVQTLTRRLKGPVGEMLPRVIFWDEAHHVAASGYKRIADHYAAKAAATNVRLYEIGLTATPCRLDGRGLDNFQSIVLGPDTDWLIRHRYLSPYRYIFTRTKLGELKKELSTRMGDYSTHDQQEKVDHRVKVIAGETIDLYNRYAQGEKAIFFGVGVGHSRRTAHEFSRRGIPAEHIDGSTLDHHRRAILRRFDAGETRILCNCNIISEGFDVPSASCVIMGRHTKSITMALQQIGRALRYVEGKRATIIDQANNYQNVGFPDAKREWTLAGKLKGARSLSRKDFDAAKLTSCHYCGYMAQNAPEKCPLCGRQMTPDIDVHSVDTEFHERLSAEAAPARRPKWAPKKPQVVLRGDGLSLTPPPSTPDYKLIRALGENFPAILKIAENCGVDNPRRFAMMWVNLNRRRLKGNGRKSGVGLA